MSASFGAGMQERMNRTLHPPREQVVNACLQPPLNDFRELMYHDPQLGFDEFKSIS